MKSNDVTIQRALLSVSNKDSIVELAQFLLKNGVEIISTGGTAKLLEENKIPVTLIQEITGNPEAFGGRMKSISFQVGSSLLYRRGHATDEIDAKNLNIKPIDLVVCNLYPFSEVVKEGGNEDELIENIDIGGPTMVRAAAKNYESVTVLTDPTQYSIFIEKYEETNSISFINRRDFAIQAFSKTAQYDLSIANKLISDFSNESTPLAIELNDKQELRYGENPHQKANFFKTNNKETPGIADANVLQGKALSYNNLLDADAAWKACSDAFHSTDHLSSKYSVSVVKHLNPCGLAVASSLDEALKYAWAGDPVSAFGGIICLSGTVNKQIAEFFSDKFVEIIIAPKFDKDAKELFSKKKNLRLLETEINTKDANELVIRSISGGVLIQDEDTKQDLEYQTVTEASFSSAKLDQARFGTVACKHLKSNGMCLVSKTDTEALWLTGAGMGQPNRLDALRYLTIPRFNLKEDVQITESVLISDAFFPFRDSIDAANEFNIKYIIQPGGSIRDEEVITACNESKIAMAFTGTRHFRH